jgi:hypothetical protein
MTARPDVITVTRNAAEPAPIPLAPPRPADRRSDQ